MKYTLIMASLALVGANAAAFSDLNLLTDERAPFEYKGNDGNPAGLAVDSISCALDKIDVNYGMKIVPWSRAQKTVEAGQADGFFAASRNDARDKYATLSDVVVEQYWNWYIANGVNAEPMSASFKADVKVSSWLGSNSLKWLTKEGYNLSKSSKTNEELVKRVVSGRLGAVYASNVVFEEALSGLGKELTSLQVVQGAYKPMGVYFSNAYLAENPGFMDSFNAAIEGCK